MGFWRGVGSFINVLMIIAGIVEFQANGQATNSSQVMLDNGTIVTLTPEEMDQAQQYAQSFLEAVRRSGVMELPLPNASELKSINETIVKDAQDILADVVKNRSKDLGIAQTQVDKLTLDTQKEQEQDQIEQLYRAELIKRMDNASCYEVYNPNVETDQLENLFKGCYNRGLIK